MHQMRRLMEWRNLRRVYNGISWEAIHYTDYSSYTLHAFPTKPGKRALPSYFGANSVPCPSAALQGVSVSGRRFLRWSRALRRAIRRGVASAQPFSPKTSIYWVAN